MAPPLLRLVCFEPEREPELRAALETAGFTVDDAVVPSGKLTTRVRETQPAAVVIDLDKLPSHGREVAVALRNMKSTRAIPLVFVGGAEEKVERTRAVLPDATYGSAKRAGTLIKQALKGKKPGAQASQPVVPVAMMDRGSTRPVAEKLGIKSGMRVAVMAAPESFLALLADGIPHSNRPGPRTELTICFVRSRLEMEREFEFLALYPPLWIAFPKQSGALRADFNEDDVRRTGLAAGLVDNKVCAIDADWSGLRFAARRRPLQ